MLGRARAASVTSPSLISPGARSRLAPRGDPAVVDLGGGDVAPVDVETDGAALGGLSEGERHEEFVRLSALVRPRLSPHRAMWTPAATQPRKVSLVELDQLGTGQQRRQGRRAPGTRRTGRLLAAGRALARDDREADDACRRRKRDQQRGGDRQRPGRGPWRRRASRRPCPCRAGRRAARRAGARKPPAPAIRFSGSSSRSTNGVAATPVDRHRVDDAGWGAACGRGRCPASAIKHADERQLEHQVGVDAAHGHDGGEGQSGEQLDERVARRDRRAAVAAASAQERARRRPARCRRARSARSQAGQREPGETSDSPRGTR